MPNLDLVCFYCMEAFHVVLQSTFMYKDHKFCSEKCRSGQIKLDMKLENVQDQIGTSNCVKKLEATNVNLSKNGKFFSAEITSHDGTEFVFPIHYILHVATKTNLLVHVCIGVRFAGT
mmetsp:Transcript_23205/g.41045  ORF Transcript_23205/g.41045 Transcript_23205/m.41045 type:complete len:118 (-) Transcript_23205:863-1216(-)